MHDAFTKQLKARQEFQSIGSVDKGIYMSYFKSVESTTLVAVVIVLFVIGQIAISSIDLIVSKWYVMDSIICIILSSFKNREKSSIQQTESVE